MLRKKLFGCTVVVAMLAAPVTLSARSMGGFGGHGFGGMHSFSGVHSFGGMRSFGMSSGWGGTLSFHHAFFQVATLRILITSTTLLASITFAITSQSSRRLLAWVTAIAGSGYQRHTVGAEYGFAIPITEHRPAARREDA